MKGESFRADWNQGAEEATKVIKIAGDIGLKLCRLYCELGVEVVVIAEEMLGQANPNLRQTLAVPLRSIWNVAMFYGVHSLILSKGCVEGDIEPILGLQAEGVALAGDIGYAQLKDAALKRNCCYARGIPDAMLFGTIPQVKASVTEHLATRGKGFFLSTEWEVPYATDVNNPHKVMPAIRDN